MTRSTCQAILAGLLALGAITSPAAAGWNAYGDTAEGPYLASAEPVRFFAVMHDSYDPLTVFTQATLQYAAQNRTAAITLQQYVDLPVDRKLLLGWWNYKRQHGGYVSIAWNGRHLHYIDHLGRIGSSGSGEWSFSNSQTGATPIRLRFGVDGSGYGITWSFGME